MQPVAIGTTQWLFVEGVIGNKAAAVDQGFVADGRLILFAGSVLALESRGAPTLPSRAEREMVGLRVQPNEERKVLILERPELGRQSHEPA